MKLIFLWSSISFHGLFQVTDDLCYSSICCMVPRVHFHVLPSKTPGQRHDQRTFIHAWLKKSKSPIQPQDKQSSSEAKIPHSATSYFPHLQRGINNVMVVKTTHGVVLVQLLHVQLRLQVRLPLWCTYTVLDKVMCTTQAIWWLGTEISISLRPLQLENCGKDSVNKSHLMQQEAH